MTHDAAQSLFDELDDLLEQERAALLSGNLDQISSLLALKEALVAKIGLLEQDALAPLQTLQQKVANNQILLDGALKGIRKAATRLAEIRQIRRTLETYGQDGQKLVIEGQVTRKVEKRA